MSVTRRAPARPLAVSLVAALAIAILPGTAARPASAFSDPNATVWINEIHYDNAGTDVDEFIEIAGPAGEDLTGWSIVRYNGANGLMYGTSTLSGTIPDLGSSGFGVVSVLYPVDGIQNGAPDGIALVDNGTLVQFLSYEGTLTATDGPANTVTSTDIGVAEASTTPVGQSLQLAGSGSTYGDFTWSTPGAGTRGSANTGQTFQADPGDEAPAVTSSSPADDDVDVALDANIGITFSEAVDVAGSWFSIACTESGTHTAAVTGTGDTRSLDPDVDFAESEICTVTIVAGQVTDADVDDPPDAMDG